MYSVSCYIGCYLSLYKDEKNPLAWKESVRLCVCVCVYVYMVPLPPALYVQNMLFSGSRPENTPPTCPQAAAHVLLRVSKLIAKNLLRLLQ